MKDIKNYENMTIQEKWNMLATVANLYYNSEMTQNEIAARMYTSRSKISRMLKEARELGIVEISIKEPWERDLDLEKQIQDRYCVKNIRVVTSKESTKEQVMGETIRSVCLLSGFHCEKRYGCRNLMGKHTVSYCKIY